MPPSSPAPVDRIAGKACKLGGENCCVTPVSASAREVAVSIAAVEIPTPVTEFGAVIPALRMYWEPGAGVSGHDSQISGQRYNLRKRAAKPAATVNTPGRKANKNPKSASGGISKAARAPKTYVYCIKPSSMARLAELEFGEHTTLVEGARFYLLPGGKKRAPSGVVSMRVTVPAGVDAKWLVEMDLEEEFLGEADEQVMEEERQAAAAEHEQEEKLEQQIQQQLENEQLGEEEQAEVDKEEEAAGNTSRRSCIVM
ncbi:hypothetical protein BZA05DRAFT_446949 [Tricharina praecox]|uniref:uncharacterized protein n=1 Tax=Tricharina praecox TaxID=43433 RepID=UPI00221F2686|nr:uncharacterized protein BZA05DRAFT_446949 [Tricharina praecox]KAI5847463.1 hypothetical protein BZA05DRAFT_446949 [Tricharina praecox]